MGQCHIVIAPELRPAVERVARILTSAEIDVGMFHRIETDLLPNGYWGVMDVVIGEGGKISLKKDEDV